MTDKDDHRDSTDVVMQLYALAVEMADRVSARRAGANSFFLALQTGLAALLATFAVRNPADKEPVPDTFVLLLAVVAGFVLALAWWLLLGSYRKLNAAKFIVINAIEKEHFGVRPFTDEWTVLRRTDTVTRWQDRLTHARDRYAELGVVEQFVPLLFAVLYLVLAYHLVTR